jgi:UDP-N-acetylmuramate dehydrogenase
MYHLSTDISLKDKNSFGIDVKAEYFVSFSSVEEWRKFCSDHPGLLLEKKFILGGGTNLLFLGDYNGLILSPEIKSISTVYHDKQLVDVEVGAGVVWDDFVAYCVEHGWYGIENLSLIPGKVGAATVQNIGAYGVEVSSVIHCVKGIELSTGNPVQFSNTECDYSYRSSIFKEKYFNTLMITSAVFRLKLSSKLNVSYGDVKNCLAALGAHSLGNLRKAILKIREAKLPDPRIIGNAGSFFKNPVVGKSLAEQLCLTLPKLPVYPISEKEVKLSAGFLIEAAGWKGHRSGKVGVHDQQALVIINPGGAQGEEILQLSQAIRADVLTKYGVNLEREVQLVGTGN